MRAVIQRVSRASVSVDDHEEGFIEKGLCILLGVAREDTGIDAKWMADKISKLRIFEDDNSRLNLSVEDVQGGLLVISQFTLYGDCRKGRRPSFVKAADPEKANQLYEFFVQKLKERGLTVNTGIFQAHMKVDICNDGPVTIILDSPGGSH